MKAFVFFFAVCTLLTFACGAPAAATPEKAEFQPVTISGTHEVHRDIRGGDAFTLTGNKVDMLVTFTVTSQPDDTLKGTAEVTYTEAYEFRYEEPDFEPCILNWTTEPITWTTDLSGALKHNPDGSLTAVLLAHSKDGPSFIQDFNCEGERAKTPEFAYIAGLLVNGKYDNKFEYVLHPMVSGSHYEITSMQLIP